MRDTTVALTEPSEASFESLGDRMKAFESVEAKRRFTQGQPVMVRLDGRSFHTFTKGMARPFHEPMSRCMIETARYLVSESHAAFAYTQSDEITKCAGSLGVQPGVESADAAGVLMGCLLLLDVLPKNVYRRTTAA